MSIPNLNTFKYVGETAGICVAAAQTGSEMIRGQLTTPRHWEPGRKLRFDRGATKEYY
jgi:hypothetical protein